MLTFIGLKSCDTCRKARRHLDNAGLEYRYIDVKADGLDTATLTQLIEALGVDTLINRRSTTWRQLDDTEKARLADNDTQAAIELLSTHPSLMKRPVLTGPNVDARAGYLADDYDTLIDHIP
ncbi:Spx/MgsR family RNA polymerase-binding regulatory protein [Larsenimonas salina]|uniref:Spx/MgsR family RNA polymerase-binding regulatory protein n=1 Tax=Larsenimonas salina TaxID=1295565 RepID=UPI0020732421|nr:Spx/MgsR family RNA polymerase-binding regulatory protein [Larsenimonas salina]MCM5704111.1 Spx/MgsR family RNA polymerase-binding regulatory protein [Larsenimonas salina]